MVLTIEVLDGRQHRRENFSCGEVSLDRYLQRQASQDLKRKVATAFVLLDHPSAEILAYYTLSAFTINISSLDRGFAKGLPHYPLLPATLLGRLAVDKQQQGRGFGELMLVDALKKAKLASNQVASLVIIAEALNDQASQFYENYGFQRFQDVPNTLYLPMQSIPL
ncbi:MAG: GNAT family N-acetyltransferase [Synechocystis sp.]|jgi:GNAT superfamily N-acetyltransferase